MPTYSIQGPDGKTYSIDGPEGATREQVIYAIQARMAEPVKPPTERTWGEAAKDVGASVASGLGGLAQFPGQLVQLVPGLSGVGQALQTPGKAISEFGEDLKSQGLKAREALRSKAISEAEKDGILAEFTTAIKETIKDPALLSTFLAEQLPLLIGPMGAARVTQKLGAAGVEAAGKGLTGKAAQEAVEEAAKALGKRATTAAYVTGSAMQAGDVSGDTYEEIYKRAIEAGQPPEQAQETAIAGARKAAAGAFGASLLAQRLPGAQAIERRLAGVPAGGRVGAALGEAAGESIEEGAGQFFKNVGLREITPEQNLLEGVGGAAGLGALGGGLIGGALGGTKPAPQESLYETANRLNVQVQLIDQEIKALTEAGQPAPDPAEIQAAINQPTEQDIARKEFGLMTNSELVDMYRDQGYGVVRQYQQRLIQRAESGELPTAERKEAIAFAEDIENFFKQTKKEEIERKQKAEPQSFLFDKKALNEFGVSKSSPVYDVLLNKDVAKPEDAEVVVASIENLLTSGSLNSEEAYFAANTLERVNEFLQTVPGSGFYASSNFEPSTGAGIRLADEPGSQPAAGGVEPAKPAGVGAAGESAKPPVGREGTQPAPLTVQEPIQTAVQPAPSVQAAPVQETVQPAQPVQEPVQEPVYEVMEVSREESPTGKRGYSVFRDGEPGPYFPSKELAERWIRKDKKAVVPEAIQVPEPTGEEVEFKQPSAPLPPAVQMGEEAAKSAEAQVRKIRRESPSLWTALRGKLSYSEVSDIGPGLRFKPLMNPRNTGSISTLVADGALDEFLPPDRRAVTGMGGPANNYDEYDNTEYIKDLLRQGGDSLLSYDTKTETAQIFGSIAEAEQLIKEYLSEADINAEIKSAETEIREATGRATSEELASATLPKRPSGTAEKPSGEGKPEVKKSVRPETERKAGEVLKKLQAETRPEEDVETEEVAEKGAEKGAEEAAPKAEPVSEEQRQEAIQKLTETRKELVSELDYTLKKILAKYGLKDVKFDLDEAMQEEGSYARQLIKIALNVDNPVRVLRHESIHALKDMGFFSPSQWKVLEKRAQDEWVEALKATPHSDTQSRYDAYVELFTQEAADKGITGDAVAAYVEEAVIEEAIADAFGAYDTTKAPVGLLTAILNRMRNLFKAIKEAFGAQGIESAEDIFGKIEEGKLKPSAKVILPSEVGDTKLSLRIMRDSQMPEIEGKVTVDKIARYFDAEILKEFGRQLSFDAKQDFDRAVSIAADEVKYQLKQEKSGLDWYEDDVRLAFEDTAKIIPDLNQADNRVLFSVIAGIMSPQTTARDNWFIAAKAYQHYVKTGDIPGVNPESGKLWQGGTTSVNKRIQLEFLDRMIKDMGKDATIKWLLSDHTVREINQFRLKYGNVKSGIDGKLTDTKPGLYAFGPKVGPFVSNLNGIHDVTVDQWMIRTFNRYFGTMIGPDGEIADAPTEPQRRAVKDLVNKVADDAKLKPYQVQSLLWFYEQRLYNKIGAPTASYGFSDGGRKFLAESGGGGAPSVATPAQADKEVAKPSLRAPKTDEFKQFISGSKAVDEKGDAIPFYHATLRDISIFRGDSAGAIFLSPDPEFSNAYFAQKLKEASERPSQYLSAPEIRAAVKRLREYVYENYGRQSKTSKDMLLSLSEAEDAGKKTGVYKFPGELSDAWQGSLYGFGVLEGQLPVGRNILPLYVNTKNPFDFEDKKQVDKLLKQLAKSEAVDEKMTQMGRFTKWPAPTQTAEEQEKIVKDYYRENILDGDWRTIELPEVQDAIKALNHDGFYINEAGEYGDIVKNLAVYSSKQLKSATGNIGTYGQRPVTSREADILGMSPGEAAKAQEEGDIRLSLRGARWTEKRIQSLLNDNSYTQGGREKDTKGYAAFISPEDFLNATSPPSYRETLEAERRPLSRSELERQTQPITLDIRPQEKANEYAIVGHEGRHRMMALRDEGIEQVPVLLRLSGGRYEPKAKSLDGVYLKPQTFGDERGVSGISNVSMVPLSWDSRNDVKQKFGDEGEVKFSIRAPKTEAFKRWFGDSKIVDANGEPLVVYHGTDQDFSAFKDDGEPIFLTPTPRRADVYSSRDGGNVMPLYARVENPASMKQYEQARHANRGKDARKKAVELLKSQGYDGVVDDITVVVFSPAQVKSAISNVGAFSRADSDIRLSLRRSVASAMTPAMQAAMDKIAPRSYDPGLKERILNHFQGDGYTFIRSQLINRYERLAEYDRRVAKMIEQAGGVQQLADQRAESAALFSDLTAGLLETAMGAVDKFGGAPVFRNGVTTISNFNKSVKGPILIFKPLSDLGDPDAFRLYQTWAAVKRGTRLLPEGRETLVTPAEIAAVRAMEKANPNLVAIFEAVQKDWIRYNNKLVTFMVDTGVLSPAMAKEYTKHGDYFPFYRLVDEDVAGPKMFTSIGNVKQPKKLKGGDAPLGDFFENIVRNSQAAIQAGIKNVAAQKATQQALLLKEVERLPKKDSGVNVYRVFENGQEVYYRSHDPLFIDAIKALNIAEMPFMGILSGPANLLRNLVTKDPAFMLANMMRDSLSAYVTTGVKMTPIVDTLKNFTTAISGRSPEMQKLYAAGVLGGYDYAQGVKTSAADFEKRLRELSGQKTTFEKAVTPFTSVWGALEKGTQASDAATRIEIYKKTLAETGSEAEAYWAALEVMNFNRRGKSPVIRILTAAIPFLNARLQGLDLLFRTAIYPASSEASKQAKERMKTFWVRGMTMMALSTMYWFMVHDDDDYKKQEQETKDNYWLIPGMGIKIPIPFEVGVMFKVIPERIAALTFGNDTVRDFTQSMTRQLESTFGFNLMPQVALPLWEAKSNFSSFTQREILGQAMKGLAPEQQIGPGTSRAAEVIAGAFSWLPSNAPLSEILRSPALVDYLIKGYTGTMGQYASDLFNAIYDMGAEKPKADKRFEQMPVIRRFLLDPEARGSVTAYYELKKAVDEAVRTSNFLERSMNFDEYGKYYQDNMNVLAVRDYINDLESSMKEAREMRQMIQNSPMSGADKKDALLAVGQLEAGLTQNIQDIKKLANR